MESLSMILSCSPPPQNHLKTPKPVTSPPLSLLQTTTTTSQPLISSPTKNTQHTRLSFLLTDLIATTAFPLPSFAADVTSSSAAADKINLETILLSVDDFLNKNPFFVAGCTFIWLVVIPLVQEYLRKYKFIIVLDAFRKLQDDPNAQLLDIRDQKSLQYLKSPNLKILNKNTAQVSFSEDDETGFVNKVLEKFENPADTSLIVLANFDGISIKVAELLFNNGFKEAYAIKGGVAGTKGWLESQETLLPPSMHIYPKKKVKTSQGTGMNGGVVQGNENSNGAASSGNLAIGESQRTDNGHTTKSTDSVSQVTNRSRASSPYPRYPDLKPPSSPTPSKP